jgi:predicted small secreted protein
MKASTPLRTVLALAALPLAACGTGEAGEDATPAGQSVDRKPAEVVAMPNNFSNVAHKCDGHGHRIYVTTNTDASRELFIVEDKTCGR